MGFVYGEMKNAKKEIKKVYKDQAIHYNAIIDMKARERLDSPLHLAGYLLNPYYTYVDPSIANDVMVMVGFIECVETMFGDDVDLQHKLINEELHKYLNKESSFGKPIALNGCAQDNASYHPVGWWNIYGNHVPNLQVFAKRVLGLTTSSSECERAWSTFAGIHTSQAQSTTSIPFSTASTILQMPQMTEQVTRLEEEMQNLVVGRQADYLRMDGVESRLDNMVRLVRDLRAEMELLRMDITTSNGSHLGPQSQ